ncbi:MAG: pyrroline-5-carboxylate reductase [Kiloniella sp.]|nr:pyrroline-5-carboxylate reductase [Kiloniella sp.]RZO30497.1 MAG: accessory factor UbiK family protein [Rhodospirillaceae bacterium]
MQNQYRFFDDLARLANGAVGTLAGARDEVEVMFRQRLEAAIAEMDVVPREEFEVVRDMARAAREENERLLKRLEELEKHLADQ